MNHSDRKFVIILLGCGLGLGIALAQKYSVIGFIGGFFFAIVFLILLLAGIRFVAGMFGKKHKKV